jgi:hypothetical protein
MTLLFKSKPVTSYAAIYETLFNYSLQQNQNYEQRIVVHMEKAPLPLDEVINLNV